jgi:exodeoxyribonuclease III
MRLMTYNILTGGIDDDGSSRLEGVAEVVQRVQPDILVLNECNELEREGRQSSFWLERALGMRLVMAFANTSYHVAIGLRTTGPAQLAQVHALRRGFHHAALVAKIGWGTRELTLIGTHLCPFMSEVRLKEAAILARYARRDDLVLLAGDLNSVSPHDVQHQDLSRWSEKRRERNLIPGTETIDARVLENFEHAGFVDVFHQQHPEGFQRTVPTDRVEPDSIPQRIDYILASPPLASAVTRTEIVRGGAAEWASDHYALFADFSL